MIELFHFQILSVILFAIGLYGVLARRSAVLILMSIELMLNAISINLVGYSSFGDFVESQAFAYLAVRSYLNLPISFPETTGVKIPCSGGIIVKY